MSPRHDPNDRHGSAHASRDIRAVKIGGNWHAEKYRAVGKTLARCQRNYSLPTTRKCFVVRVPFVNQHELSAQGEAVSRYGEPAGGSQSEDSLPR